MASKELFHLLRILDERDTGLGREDVAWAFEPAKKAETEDWVKTYLSPATLLTKEEFAFHERFGEFTPQINSASSGRPLTDEDFEHAITSLESSTAAIDAQCQLMEAQKRALLDFKAKNVSSSENPDKQQHKLARDRAQLDLELNELSGSLHEKLRTSMTQAETASTSLPSKVERLLEKDDRILDGLQKILPKIAGSENETITQKQIDDLCNAFTQLEGEAIRAKVDATYQEHLPLGSNMTLIVEDDDDDDDEESTGSAAQATLAPSSSASVALFANGTTTSGIAKATGTGISAAGNTTLASVTVKATAAATSSTPSSSPSPVANAVANNGTMFAVTTDNKNGTIIQLIPASNATKPLSATGTAAPSASASAGSDLSRRDTESSNDDAPITPAAADKGSWTKGFPGFAYSRTEKASRPSRFFSGESWILRRRRV